VEELDERPAKRGGLSRRELIKRSAIVGGVAWTAPMIIDSIASPAGAISGGISFGGYSYGIILILEGPPGAQTLCAITLGASSCSNGNSGSNDTSGTIGTCHGFNLDFNVTADKAIGNTSTNAAVPALVLVLGHKGTCNNATGGINAINHLSMSCAALNTVTLPC